MHATASVLKDDPDAYSESHADDATDSAANSESDADNATDGRPYADTYVPTTEEWDRMLAKVQAAAQAQPRLCTGAVCNKDMVFTEELLCNVDHATLHACVLLSARSFCYKPDFLQHNYDDFYNSWCDNLDYTQTMLASMNAGRKYKNKADFQACAHYLLNCASHRAVVLTGRCTRSNKICCACKLTYDDVGSIDDATPTYQAYLYNVCAFPVSRGHGRQLMQHVKMFCNKQPEIQSIKLYVDKDEYMYGTLKFYKSVGFQSWPEDHGGDIVFMSYQCTPHAQHMHSRMNRDGDGVGVVHMLNPWHMQEHDDLQRQHAGMAASQHTRDILDYTSQQRRIARKST